MKVNKVHEQRWIQRLRGKEQIASGHVHQSAELFKSGLSLGGVRGRIAQQYRSLDK